MNRVYLYKKCSIHVHVQRNLHMNMVILGAVDHTVTPICTFSPLACSKRAFYLAISFYLNATYFLF